MLKVGVVGATGYTGEELVKILASHPKVKLTFLTAKIDKDEIISNIYPSLKGKCDLVCKSSVTDDLFSKAELVFLALPHKVSMDFVPKFLKSKAKIIDLSADYRLPSDIYETWYGMEHKDKENIKNAVYGLPELYKDKIKSAELIANPGCYPTSIILGLAPIIKGNLNDISETIIADSKSGVTGAGRKADISISFAEVNESLKAYKINEHQHMPEIIQEISKLSNYKLELIFVPHLIPMNRGILSTIYVKLNDSITNDKLTDIYKKFYANSKFIRIMPKGVFPQVKEVSRTNICSIGIKVDEKKKIAVIISCIDNLLKGAAGQAVQNMNIMYGFEEDEGLL